MAILAVAMRMGSRTGSGYRATLLAALLFGYASHGVAQSAPRFTFAIRIPGPSDRGAARMVDADGTERHYVVRGARLSVTGERVEVGQLFGADIVGVARIGDRYVFVTSDGLVVSASTFAGPPSPIGEMEPPVRIGTFGGRDRLVVLDGNFVARTVGPSLRLEIVPRFPEGDVTHVSFASSLDGAVVHDGGRLAVTHDGGRRWSPVPDRGLGVLRAHWVGTELFVATLRGPATIDPTSGAVRSSDARDPEPPAPSRVQMAAWLYAGGYGPNAPDSEVLVVDDGALWKRTLAHGTEGGERLGTVPQGCTQAQRFLDGFLFACGASRRKLTRDFEHWEDVAWRGPPVGGRISSRYGYALWLDPCRGDRVTNPSHAVCVARGISDPGRSIELPFEALDVAGVTSTGFVFAPLLSADAGFPGFFLDVASGRLEQYDPPFHPPRYSYSLSDASVTHDDTAIFVMKSTMGVADTQAVARRADGTWRVFPLPEGAVSLAGVDDSHLVAAGRDLGDVWWSDDAGTTFHRLQGLSDGPSTLQVDGAVARSDYWDARRVVDCSSEACLVGRFVRIAWSPGVQAAPLAVRTGSPFTWATVGADLLDRIPGVRCDGPLPPLPDEHTGAARGGVGVTWSLGPRARLEWSTWEGATVRRVQRDLPPEVAALLASEPCPGCSDDPENRWTVTPFVASRSALLLQACSAYTACTTWLVPSSGAVASVFGLAASDGGSGIDDTRMWPIVDAIGTDAGRVLVHQAIEGNRVDSFRILDGTGRIVATTEGVVRAPAPRVFARNGAVHEILASDPADARIRIGRAILPDAFSEQDDVWPALPAWDLRICGSVRPPDAREIRVPGFVGGPDEAGTIGHAIVRIRVHPTGHCIEGIEASSRALVLRSNGSGRLDAVFPPSARGARALSCSAD